MTGLLPERWNDDGTRAISDLVAFVLTFSVIITAVGAVSIGGLGSLEDFRDEAQADSAEIAMTGFDASIEDIRTDRVPQRSHQLQLNGDGLARHSSKLNVTINTTSGNESVPVAVGAFVRESGEDTDIVYESGAVYRSQRQGQVAVREPPFRCGSDTAMLGLVSVRGEVNLSSSNAALTLRRDDDRSASIHPNLTAGGNASANYVLINVSETRDPAAWRQILDRDLDRWHKTGANTYECTGISSAYVYNTTVELDAVT